jgi:hypothetical protein
MSPRKKSRGQTCPYNLTQLGATGGAASPFASDSRWFLPMSYAPGINIMHRA